MARHGRAFPVHVLTRPATRFVFAPTVASAAGTGDLSAIGISTAASPFSSAGAGAASGVGISSAASPFACAGVGDAAGIGKSTAAAPFSAAGASDVHGRAPTTGNTLLTLSQFGVGR